MIDDSPSYLKRYLGPKGLDQKYSDFPQDQKYSDFPYGQDSRPIVHTESGGDRVSKAGQIAEEIMQGVIAMRGEGGEWLLDENREVEVDRENGLLYVNITTEEEDDAGVKKFQYFKITPCDPPAKRGS